MRRIKDDELREYQEEIGQVKYRKNSMYARNLSKRIRQNNLRASREHYENAIKDCVEKNRKRAEGIGDKL